MPWLISLYRLQRSSIFNAFFFIGLLSRTHQVKADSYPYSCKWISQVTPDAIISFSSESGFGTYNGATYYKGKFLHNFHEGNTMGYGSNWYYINEPQEDLRAIIVFRGNYPERSLFKRNNSKGNVKLLIVGMGYIYRNIDELKRAFEGFWIPGLGCRHRYIAK